jgi:antitoxin component YwqK of YwqJK toxin-antitoxin module
MKKIIHLNGLILFLLIQLSCQSHGRKSEVVTLIDKKNNSIEKGLLIDGKKEGYWATFDTNYVIKYDIEYKNNIPDGKTTNFYEGSIVIEAEMENGKSNGPYVSYHKYPIKEAEGNVQMEKRVGEWKTYAKDGRLNKIILFEKDTFKILVDNHLDN